MYLSVLHVATGLTCDYYAFVALVLLLFLENKSVDERLFILKSLK